MHAVEVPTVVPEPSGMAGGSVGGAAGSAASATAARSGSAASGDDEVVASGVSDSDAESATGASESDADRAAGASAIAADRAPGEEERPFSFFVTSLAAMQTLSGSQDGFGGDLGGLAGADAICQTIAEGVGAGDKTWRAFLSVTAGPDGTAVNAIDRIGEGPWYDANGRLVASGIEGLLGTRPDGDPQTVNDLPDEHGVPLSTYGDSHDILTGSNGFGQLYSTDPASTCNDWTSTATTGGSSAGAIRSRRGGRGWPGGGGESSVMAGHSWPRGGGGRGMDGDSWISAHGVPGCAAGINLSYRSGPGSGGDCVGCAGGYGAIYCFALTP